MSAQATATIDANTVEKKRHTFTTEQIAVLEKLKSGFPGAEASKKDKTRYKTEAVEKAVLDPAFNNMKAGDARNVSHSSISEPAEQCRLIRWTENRCLVQKPWQ